MEHISYKDIAARENYLHFLKVLILHLKKSINILVLT